MDAKQFQAKTTKQPEIAFAYMPDFIVMRMNKVKCEKGYWVSNFKIRQVHSFEIRALLLPELCKQGPITVNNKLEIKKVQYQLLLNKKFSSTFHKCQKLLETFSRKPLKCMTCKWNRYPITGIQLQQAEIRYLQLDTCMIKHQFRDKKVCREPITINN